MWSEADIALEQSWTTRVKDWHPVSKFVTIFGILVLGFLLLTEEQHTNRIAAAASPPRDLPQAPGRLLDVPDLPGLDTGGYTLPPASRFEAMIERPLFSPMRRPSEPVLVAIEYEPVIEPAAGPDEPVGPLDPTIAFVGSLKRSGETLALITREREDYVQAIRTGDEIDGWKVVEVGERSLELEAAGERRRLEIFN
ncbi:MAG: hypothetical protein R3C97_03730 [Geminicoccaceae bacterium]